MPDEPLPTNVDYQRDIQPILSGHCFQCHGPDESTRLGNLRLDTFEGATDGRGTGRFPIVPGHPEQSVLITRVSSVGSRQMPPPPNAALTPQQVRLLRAWIASGARYTRHWSLSRPTRADPPDRQSNPVDAFIDAALAQRGIEPSPEAAPEVLLRRLTLDLTGLPPTPEEVDAFVASPTEDAYLAAVDRLLASSAHAEHLTRDWLDFSGYGDTNAAYVDDERQSWPWRDWVLASFRANRPMDDFIVHQLAGDLLPGASESDVLATGFLRLHPTSSEGGIDPEEWRFQHSLDRGRLVGNQLLGLTVHCAQCHDHKYDPISQRDFYALVACFDRVGDRGMVNRPDTEAPSLTSAGPLAQERQSASDARVRDLMATLSSSAVTSAQARWEASVREATPRWRAPRGVTAAALVGSPVTVNPQGEAQPEGALVPVESVAFTLRGESRVRALRLSVGEARPGGAAPVITEVTADVQSADRRERVRFAFAHLADSSGAANVIDGSNRTGTGFNAPGTLVLVPEAPLDAEGAEVVVRVEQRWGGGAVANRLSLEVSEDEASILSPAMAEGVRASASERTAEQAASVSRAFAAAGEGSPVREAARELREIELSSQRLRATVTRVMRDDDAGRRTYVMTRGVFGQRGAEVRCAVPAALTLDGNAQSVTDRLSLARWMVSAESPTTARIIANRYVQRVFGRGLIGTPDDLGVRGTAPSNPELLDWLAVELRESGWNLRAFLRLLVTSRAYRRSSVERPALTEVDPQNLLLARAHRVRLDAEVVRDQASFASGLLTRELGGPPVFPYHPEGIYEAINDAVGDLTTYRPDVGVRQIHRRAMYGFWRRATLLPSLSLMDAPVRIFGVSLRDETNTPTQALAILNEPFFVESARVLAERARREAPDDVDGQIALVFRHVLGRRARADEVALARRAYDAELAELRGEADPRRVLMVGEAPFDAAGDAAAHAAMTLVARAVLGSSEALNRE